MMLMISLFGLGITALWLTSGNMQVGTNVNQRTQALYCAEAGIERARSVLNALPAPNINTLLKGSGDAADDIPSTLDASGNPVGVGAILLDGTTVLKAVAFPPTSFKRGTATATAPVSATMGTYTVWIRNDTAECRQGNYLNDANGSVRIRSRGLAPDNLTTVVLEVAMGGAPGGPGTTHEHVVRARAVQLGQELLRRQHARRSAASSSTDAARRAHRTGDTDGQVAGLRPLQVHKVL